MAVDHEETERRRRKVEALLWAWAEHATNGAPAVSGYPSASPTHRMMRSAGPSAAGRSGGCDMWRQRQRRVGQGADQRLELEPPQTVFGRETTPAVFEDYTAPERDADRMGPPMGRLTAAVYCLADRSRAIIELKFIDGVRHFQDIAAELRADYPDLNKNTVPVWHNAALDQIYRTLFELPRQTRRSIMPDLMPVS